MGRATTRKACSYRGNLGAVQERGVAHAPMTTLYFDLETYSDVPINHGTHRYAASAEIIILAYAFDDAPVAVVDYPTPLFAQQIIDRAETVVAHNSFFDRTVLAYQKVALPTDKVQDTMAIALAHSLPGSLDKLCGILGLSSDSAKDADGKRLIHLFCKPQPKNHKVRRHTEYTKPDEWVKFRRYAGLDVVAMREVYRRLPKWNCTPFERQLWLLDQGINDRGFATDTDLVAAATAALKDAKSLANDRASDATNGYVTSATRRDAVLNYLAVEHGIVSPDLRGNTVDRLLELDLPEPARELLLARVDASTTSTAKYGSLTRATSADGRLRGALQYCGAARTGRWAGRLFQPQNLPRPAMGADVIEAGIAALKRGQADLAFDVVQLASSALRGAIVAPPGRQLLVADLANIEGRVLAWLAGEQWKLDAYRAYDNATGPDLYKTAYARSYRKQPEDVTKDERQIGKVMELALGYQGAVGAFSTMAALYGVDLPEEEVRAIVKAWRDAHPATVGLWRDLEDAARRALEGKNSVAAGPLVLERRGSWLRMRLPSGRYLCYPGARIDTQNKLTYMGVNQYTRKWERLKTYGGKLAENATQAVARDVLANGMLQAQSAGMSIVLSVHDEIIAETHAHTASDLVACMVTLPTWAAGLPLAAEGYASTRYRK